MIGNKAFAALALVVALFSSALPALADGATVVSGGVIWADGTLYRTVLTPTALPVNDGNLDSFDSIYNFASSGLAGQRSISDAAPGEPGFNGGRWLVYLVTVTPQGMTALDPDGDGAINSELTSADQLMQQVAMGNLTIGSAPVQAFVCTVNPNPK